MAGDFAFATRVNSALYESGQTNPTTEARQIEDVLTPDPRTLVIRWSSLYIGAETPALEPFPEHILAEPLAAGDLQAFASLPYWTTAYVGAGPYRLDRWEPGAFIDGTAFDRYALGTPKITRVRITWSADPNVALAGLLSDQYQMAADTAIEFEQVATIEDRWGPAGGRVILNPTQVRYQMVQARPEFVDPPTLLDVRVRRALYQAIDRRALATAMLGDEAIVADSLVPPKTSFFKDLDAAIQKYPYDPRATEQLMAEAGFSKDQEGMFVGPAGARFAPALWGIAQGQEAQETTAVADFYRRAGVDVRLNLIPQARYTQDRNVVLNQFPALRDTYCTLLLDRCMDKFASSLIASADTRWQGQNRIGWANAEFDAYYDQYWKSLEPAERDRTVVEMARILSKELPSLPFYFNVSVVAHSARLHGPKPVAPLTTAYWDIHEWTMGERYGRNVTSPLAERWIQADS